MHRDEVETKFRSIKNPLNYFAGRGRLPFPSPENILLFYRQKFEITGLGLQTDFHYRYVLIFNFSEQIKIFLDGIIVQINSGEGFLILPFQYHRFINEGQKNISLAFITCSMDENVYFEPLRNTTFAYSETTMNLVSSLLDAYFSDDSGPIPSYLALILTDIAANHEITPLTRAVQTSSVHLTVQICKTIYNNKAIGVKEIASRLGYSESYIRAYFKRTMKLSIGRFIIELRLTEAMRLLSRTNQQISVIAELSGYESVYSFSRSFKTHVGLNPKQYRYKVQILKETDEKYQFRVGNRPHQ